ncbi:MAG: CYTH domain-containing protein [Bradymonadaceae bacterium]
MGIEIERKFLVNRDDWRDEVDRSTAIRQGYFQTRLQRSLPGSEPWRDPAEPADGTTDDEAVGLLTVKGNADGPVRDEYEYPIPAADAEEMLAAFCERREIRKSRHRIGVDGREWVVDEFHGDNDGLVLAEIELDDADQEIDFPGWIGREVTDEPEYTNAALAREPWTHW